MDVQELQAALCNRAHASFLKKVEYTYAELAKQFQAGHLDIFPLDAVMALPNLCLSP